VDDVADQLPRARGRDDLVDGDVAGRTEGRAGEGVLAAGLGLPY
jgi:hypothetical protein